MRGSVRQFAAVMALMATVASAGVAAQAPAVPATPPAGVNVPTDYLIGPQDVLSIVFWREKDMTVDVVVRPDGKISLPLLNDIEAAGQTPDALRAAIAKAATKFFEEPSVSVVVKEIKSRNVSITGQVTKPGSYELTSGMTVLQLIAVSGGLLEYADAKNIVVMRKENGRDRAFKFNYKDVIKQKNVEQNIVLKPGDIVLVP